MPLIQLPQADHIGQAHDKEPMIVNFDKVAFITEMDNGGSELSYISEQTRQFSRLSFDRIRGQLQAAFGFVLGASQGKRILVNVDAAASMQVVQSDIGLQLRAEFHRGKTHNVEVQAIVQQQEAMRLDSRVMVIV